MPESLVLDWLNENEYRAYPLRTGLHREMTVVGKGVISTGPFNAVVGGYLINGGTDIAGNKTQFLTQVAPGDVLLVDGHRAAIIIPASITDFSDTTLYVATDLSGFLSPTQYTYSIIKKSFSSDPANVANFSLEGILLDANLVYNSVADETRAGQLLSITPASGDLVLTVYGQPAFVVPSYLSASYPYYARNAAGSLLVVGQSAKNIATPLSFSSNMYFEPSVVTIMDGDWRGVTSLTFNGETPLAGDLIFEEGYQLGLQINPAKNSLKISAGRGFGQPIGCDRIYSTTPADCDELISYVSNVAPRGNLDSVDLIPGTNISIYPDPDRHRIYVGLNFEKPDICVAAPQRPVTPV